MERWREHALHLPPDRSRSPLWQLRHGAEVEAEFVVEVEEEAEAELSLELEHGASSEDPQDFLDRCHKVVRNMGIVDTNGVDFAAFQLTGFARRWWRDYMLTRLARSPTLTWDQFSQLFLETFIPVTLREEYHRKFERLQQGGMTITQLQMAKETGSDITFQMAVDIARRIEGAFARVYPPRPFHSELQASHNASGGHGPYVPHSGQPALISIPPIQSYQSGYSVPQGQFPGQQSQQPRACYTCGDMRLIAIFCPRSQGSVQQQGSHAMILAPVAPPPTHPDKGKGQAARGGGQAIRGGGQAFRGGGQPTRSRPSDVV
ncbi:uncharacterized protein [Nicotiana tomentosiformis]|uniref:uncharacterized protein n=1 Tax=Nicotiana tomentosiformis TaxID=4098 RepID=UPI00388C5684